MAACVCVCVCVCVCGGVIWLASLWRIAYENQYVTHPLIKTRNLETIPYVFDKPDITSFGIIWNTLRVFKALVARKTPKPIHWKRNLLTYRNQIYIVASSCLLGRGLKNRLITMITLTIESNSCDRWRMIIYCL